MSKLIFLLSLCGILGGATLLMGCQENTVDLSKAGNQPYHPPGEKPGPTTSTTTTLAPGEKPEPTPTPAPPRVSTRIVCESQPDASVHLSTLSNSAGPNFVIPEFNVRVDGKDLMGLKSPLSLVSDGRYIDMYFLGSLPTERSYTQQWTLYNGIVDMYSRSGTGTALWELPAIKGSWTDQLQRLKINPEAVALARLERVVFSPDKQSQMYNLRDLSRGTVIKNFNLSAQDYGQPLFSVGAQSVLLQTSKNLIAPLALGLTRLNTQDGSLSALPALKDTRVQWSAAYLGTDRIFWLEKSSDKTFVRTLSAGSPAFTIHSRNDVTVHSLALLEMPTGDYQILLLLDNGISLLTVQRTLAISKVENFVAPERMGKLSSPVFAPWSDDVYFSRGGSGGLVGFNLKTLTYRSMGLDNTAFKCLNPTVGPEVVFPEAP